MSTSRPAHQHLSQHERARRVLNENQISVDLKLHTFTVMGSTCPHVVTLFPKETCSCPSTTQCYHILAAKMSIGQHSEDEKSRINLPQLRKNSCPWRQKRSGRKCPRPGDCNVMFWCCNQIERTEISNKWWWVSTNSITRLPKKDCEQKYV